MNEIDTTLKWDDMEATAIAIAVKALPPDVDVSAVFPYLYEHGLAILVNSHGTIQRIITNVKLDNDEPILVDSDLQVRSRHARVRELRMIFESTSQKLVPLVDEHEHYTGYCASRNELMKLWAGEIHMPRIGGLATPLGVYLTTGVHTTGAGTYGLVLTGISFAVFVLSARFGFQYMAQYSPFVHELNDVFQMAIVFVMLLLFIRFSPLSGLHAAEHQTIHVIEKGLPLTPENVLAQPRDHRRCGTNVMVGLVGLEMGYLGAMMMPGNGEYAVVFIIVWLIVLVLCWQQIGVMVQRLFTTTRPNRRQVENAIRAGKNLIERFRMRPHGNANVWQRVWGSGVIQILASFAFTTWIIQQFIDIWVRRF